MNYWKKKLAFCVAIFFFFFSCTSYVPAGSVSSGSQQSSVQSTQSKGSSSSPMSSSTGGVVSEAAGSVASVAPADDASIAIPGSGPWAPTQPVCGDGFVSGTEQCEPRGSMITFGAGTSSPSYAWCSSSCQYQPMDDIVQNRNSDVLAFVDQFVNQDHPGTATLIYRPWGVLIHYTSISYSQAVTLRNQLKNGLSSFSTCPNGKCLIANGFAHTATDPDDPKFLDQWNLCRTATPLAWSGLDMSIYNQNVKIAHIDTGVDINPSNPHPDLDPSKVIGVETTCHSSNCSVTDHLPVYNDYTPYLEHGTQTFGVIAAKMNNAAGIAGVAPNVSYYIVNASQKYGSGDAAQASPFEVLDAIWRLTTPVDDGGNGIFPQVIYIGFNFASDPNNVFNINQQVTNSAELYPSLVNTLVVLPTVDRPITGGSIDFNVCDADGNGVYTDPCPYMVIVTSTDGTDHKTAVADYGPGTALGAPGTNIWTTNCRNIPANKCTDAGTETYISKSGASIAAAHVTGALALMYSLDRSPLPDLTAADAKTILTDAVDYYPPSYNIGAGRLDINCALKKTLDFDDPCSPAELSVDAVADPSSGKAPLTTHLTCSTPGFSSCYPRTYLWNLGDGTQSSDDDFLYTYCDPASSCVYPKDFTAMCHVALQETYSNDFEPSGDDSTNIHVVECNNNNDCDDLNICNGIETCQAGVCVDGTPLACDDGNLCNGTETCNPASGCVPGTALDCNDSNACTTDSCEPASGCIHTVITCDDSNACTTDSCDSASGCAHAAVSCDDSDACTTDSCEPASGCQHTGVICNDQNACNGVETCDAQLGCQPGTPLTCDDGNLCNGTETCNPASGCVPGTALDCNDSNACTTDSCEPASGCIHTVITCDDSNACTTDSCDSASGCAHAAVSCDDSDACTTDSCEPASGCQHTGVICNDQNACNGVETCDAQLGCQPGTPLTCDDGNLCNGTETCNPASGCVPGTALDCNDSNACTTDSCEPASGCIHTVITCDDSNACTTDSCDSASGCAHAAVSCDDSDACTTDSCDTALGCQHTGLICNDQNACNGIETCDAQLGCQPGTPLTCDDGNLCNGTETCNPVSGCVPGTALNCDDSDACTTDSCDTALGCQHTGLICNDQNACNGIETCDVQLGCQPGTPLTCDDGNLCNGTETCNPASGCMPGTALDCNDSNACTTDSCEPASGCIHTVITCDDSNACTTDSCDSASGCAHAAVSCDDSDACTTDSCDTALGCQHTGLICNDQNACNGVETCDAQLGCQPGTPLTCNDSNPCTDDSCNPATGCVYTNDDTNSCVDTNFCNGTESCHSGVCQAGTSPCPSDGQFCNGTESCNEGTDQCDHSGNPCADDGLYCNGAESCNETNDQCVHAGNPCSDDGLFCDGAESCNETTNQCVSSGNPCPAGQTCDEAQDQCIGSTVCGVVGGYAGGDGTVGNPYKINTPAQFDGIRNCRDKHFELTSDISLSASSLLGKTYLAIGEYDTASSTTGPFTGSLNGNNHRITELKGRTAPDSQHVGLFGYMTYADSDPQHTGIIKNLIIENADFTEYHGGLIQSQEGILVGQLNPARQNNLGGLIENCRVSGSISGYGSNAQIGGLVGSNSGGRIVNSHATVDIVDNPMSATGNIGGLAGDNYHDGVIDHCSSNGTITATAGAVGGLVGVNGSGGSDGSGTVEDSFSTVNVSSFSVKLGGLIGDNRQGNVYRSFSSADFITTHVYSGGLIGMGGLIGTVSSGSVIEDSYSTTDVFVEGLEGPDNSSIVGTFGGLIGAMGNSAVRRCYATGDVKGDTSVGGLVGMAGGSLIENSYSRGQYVSGVSLVGGLVGNVDGSSEVRNSYSTSYVYGDQSREVTLTPPYAVGGLVGGLDGTVENSYSTGLVVSDPVPGGGLIGYKSLSCSAHPNYHCTVTADCRKLGFTTDTCVDLNQINNSYWDMETSGRSYSAGGEGKTTAEMKSQSTFSGWADFSTNWIMDDGSDYPRKSFTQQCEIGASTAGTFAGGSGTAADPYLICTAEQLNNVRTEPAGDGLHYKLVGNINLSPLESGHQSDPNWFEPIGPRMSQSDPRFNGTFDGANYAIIGFQYDGTQEDVERGINPINSPNYSANVGFIRLPVGANLKNINLVDIKVRGSHTVGGLAGVNEGNIVNCKVSGNIGETVFAGHGVMMGAGGFVGTNNASGQILKSHAVVNVDATDTYGMGAGGFAAYNYGLIQDSYAIIGNVTATIGAGGFVYTIGGDGIIERSFVKGKLVLGRDFIGGLAAAAFTNAQIKNAYSRVLTVENLAAASDNPPPPYYTNTGGLVGYLDVTSIVHDSYATSKLVATVGYLGGLVAYNGAPTPYSNVTDSYWDVDHWDVPTLGQPISRGGEGMSDIEMRTEATFSAWDSNVWKYYKHIEPNPIYSRYYYPVLSREVGSGLEDPDINAQCGNWFTEGAEECDTSDSCSGIKYCSRCQCACPPSTAPCGKGSHFNPETCNCDPDLVQMYPYEIDQTDTDMSVAAHPPKTSSETSAYSHS